MTIEKKAKSDKNLILRQNLAAKKCSTVKRDGGSLHIPVQKAIDMNVTRRRFLRNGVCFTGTSSLALTQLPVKANAWFAAVAAIISVAFELYQAMNQRDHENFEFQLLGEAVDQIGAVHDSLGGIEVSLSHILFLLQVLPEEFYLRVVKALESEKSKETIGACKNLLDEVSRLSTTYRGKFDSIPAERFASVRRYLETLREHRSALSEGSDLNALSLCAAAITELATEKFLGTPRNEAKVTAYRFLDRFSKMHGKQSDSLSQMLMSARFAASLGDGTKMASLIEVSGAEVLEKSGGVEVGGEIEFTANRYLFSVVYEGPIDFWATVSGFGSLYIMEGTEPFYYRPPTYHPPFHWRELYKVDNVMVELKVRYDKNPFDPTMEFAKVASHRIFHEYHLNGPNENFLPKLPDVESSEAFTRSPENVIVPLAAPGMLVAKTSAGLFPIHFYPTDNKVAAIERESEINTEISQLFIEEMSLYHKKVQLVEDLEGLIHIVRATEKQIGRMILEWPNEG